MIIHFLLKLLLVGLFFLASCKQDDVATKKNGSNANLIANGKQLFSENCSSCHALDMTSSATAPALGGVTLRRNKTWLHSFTRNSMLMIQNGDTTAISVAATFNNAAMPAYEHLDSLEIESIYAYVEAVYAEESAKRK